METEKKTIQWMQYVAPCLSLLAPMLYVVGFLYDSGFLSHFGAASLLESRSPQDYFILSFFVFFIWSAQLIEFTQCYIVLFFLGILLLGILRYFLYTAVDRLGEQHAPKLRPRVNKRELLASADWTQKLTNFLTCVCLTAAILVVVGKLAFITGESQAKIQQAAFKGCDTVAGKTKDCVSVMDADKPIITGFLVARSSSRIAIYRDGKTNVMPLKEYVIVTYAK